MKDLHSISSMTNANVLILFTHVYWHVLKAACHCLFKMNTSRMTVAFKWKKAWPVLITSLTHMLCQQNRTKWDQFRLDEAHLRESSFSKTLISGPQISCQSSAVHSHRIGEKAVPNKSTTCQSPIHPNTCSQLSTQEGTHLQAETCMNTRTQQSVNVSLD